MKSVRIQLFISGPFFSTFITNRIKYEPVKIPNSKTFHTVQFVLTFSAFKMMLYTDPVDIYMFKVNNRNTRARCEIYSKLMFLLLTLSR